MGDTDGVLEGFGVGTPVGLFNLLIVKIGKNET